MMSGYVYRPERAYIGNIWITNFQDFLAGIDHGEAQDHFWIASELEKEGDHENSTFIQRIGAWPAMTSEDEGILRKLLETSASEETLIAAGVGLMRRMADRPIAGGTVGHDIAVTIVPQDRSRVVTSRIRNCSDSDRLVNPFIHPGMPPGSGSRSDSSCPQTQRVADH